MRHQNTSGIGERDRLSALSAVFAEALPRTVRVKIAARYYDAQGVEFSFDEVYYDSVGNVYLDQQRQLPLPFYLTEEQA